METRDIAIIFGIIAGIVGVGTFLGFVIYPLYHGVGDKNDSPTPTPTPTQTQTQTQPVIASPLPSQTQMITETPESTPSPIPTETHISTPPPTLPDGIDQLPPIEWGIMETYFDISDKTLEKAEYTDVLGRVYEYDSINFIVEAKRSFYAIIIFEAEFYDEDGIKVYSSFVDFDPDYDQWQSGDKSRGHVELPSTSDMEKVRHIKISQFI